MPVTRSLKEEIRIQIKGIVILAIAVLCYAGLKFTEQTGEFGVFINNVLRTMAGETALVIPFLIGVYSLKLMLPQQILNLRSRLTGVIILLLLFTTAYHLNMMLNQLELFPDGNFYAVSYELGLQHQGGGLIGAVFSMVLFFFFRDIGSYIVIVTLAIISILLITNVSLTQLLLSLRKALGLFWLLFKKFVCFLKEIYFLIGAEEKDNTALPEQNEQESNKREDPQKELKKDARYILDQPALLKPEHEKEQHAPPTAKNNKKEEQYQKPPLSLLTKLNRLRSTQQQNNGIKERTKILQNTLKSFGVKAKVVNVLSGPTVTRFEIQPEVGVKVSKINSLADDLALNLAAPDIRIEAPIPGKAAIGIEVPNKIISPVYLRDVLEDDNFQNSFSPLVIGLGKNITGAPVIADLLKMPHLLIAGATGSGKSVCLNSIIASILFKATPQEVKLLLIDPKFVELSTYNGIPHLLLPVVTQPKQASFALKNMVKEMGRRYELFAKEGVRDIASYNKHASSADNKEEFLPYIVVFIDELADLMMISPAEVEDAIVRLSQMSRAAGIHLVIATQRPSVDVLTGIIKANITSRIAFTVSSQIDSRTILDMGGAEKLLGHGDMLYFPVDATKPFRIQGAYISEKEIRNIVQFVKEQGEAVYREDLVPSEQEKQGEDTEFDELFPEAVELLVRVGQASISLLQRRFRIGYTRAARLIDDLEKHGIVGAYEGSKPREVMISTEQASKICEDFKKREESY